MTTLPDDLIDLETARAETGKATGTIRTWIRAGKIRAWKRGYYNYVSRAELRSLIARIESFLPANQPIQPPPYAAGESGEERANE